MEYNTLIVLAGGFGTRLKSEINNLPKALAPVCGKPFLGYLIENWVSQGINHFIFSLHYEANQVIDYINALKSNVLANSKVEYVVEEVPLGTGGAIVNAMLNAKLTDSFLVANADTWLSTGVNELLAADKVSLSLVKVDSVSRYGEVIIDADNQIVNFNEKNGGDAPGYINAGLYKLHPGIFSDFLNDPFSFESDFLPQFISSRKVNAVILNSSFIDIGIPSDYHKFQRWIEGNKISGL